MDNLLTKIKELNKVFKQSSIHFVSLDKLCIQLSDILGSNIYISTSDGGILAYATFKFYDCQYTEKSLESKYMPQRYVTLYKKIRADESHINEYEPNPSCSYLGHEICMFKDMYLSILPIVNDAKTIAFLTLIRYGNKFTDDEMIVCEYASSIISIEIYRRNQTSKEQEAIDRTRVSVAISVLSYTELQAINAILEDLKNDEGFVVVNKIANSAFITRSVVANALRKLESAQIIRTKSLGIKGTHIKILNKYLYEEIIRCN